MKNKEEIIMSEFTERLNSFSTEGDQKLRQTNGVYKSDKTTKLIMVDDSVKGVYMYNVTPLFLSNPKLTVYSFIKHAMNAINNGMDWKVRFDNSTIDADSIVTMITDSNDIMVAQITSAMYDESFLDCLKDCNEIFTLQTPFRETFDEYGDIFTIDDIISEYDDETIIKVIPFIRKRFNYAMINTVCEYIESGVDLTTVIVSDVDECEVREYYTMLDYLHGYGDVNLEPLKGRELVETLREYTGYATTGNIEEFIRKNQL